MKAAVNLSTDMINYFDEINLPKNIDAAAWTVLASWLLDNNQGSTLAHSTFSPRKLITDNIDKFSLGKQTISVGDWCCKL